MADILSCLDPKLQSLYEARKAQHSDSLWNFSWPNLSKDKKRWYLPVRWDGTSRLVFVASSRLQEATSLTVKIGGSGIL